MRAPLLPYQPSRIDVTGKPYGLYHRVKADPGGVKRL